MVSRRVDVCKTRVHARGFSPPGLIFIFKTIIPLPVRPPRVFVLTQKPFSLPLWQLKGVYGIRRHVPLAESMIILFAEAACAKPNPGSGSMWNHL